MIPARCFRTALNLGALLIAVVSISSCAVRRPAGVIPTKPPSATPAVSSTVAQRNNEIIKQEALYRSPAATVPYTALTYIERFKKIAIQEMNLYGIPASITLAQGLFESGNGNSDLAKYANNHFGIKCTSDWKGKSYYKNDDIENDCFRVYDNPENSYRDHSEFLKRKRYAALFELDKNDYEGWANGLKAAGYATNPKYPELLINVIKRYQLDQYDRPESEEQKIKREDRVLTQINNNIGKEVKESVATATPAAPGYKLYEIQKGDTLYNVSKRFGLTVDELKALNNMGDNNIKIGQKLVVVK